jgi:hypothetical protein
MEPMILKNGSVLANTVFQLAVDEKINITNYSQLLSANLASVLKDVFMDIDCCKLISCNSTDSILATESAF